MNTILIARYLQYLRKRHHHTQEELAKKLGITRQSVSKWETGAAFPDIESLLELSRLYGITINDILEPAIPPQRITDFEQITTIPEGDLQKILQAISDPFDTDCLAVALMGASPTANSLCAKLLPEIDLAAAQHRIGRVKIERVQEMQAQIVSMINLQAAEQD